MSHRDEDFDPAVEELLQRYEREEAAVLRAELVEFLKSPECRDELAQTVQKPLEKIVLDALSNAKFQEQIRDAIIASLKPEIVKAAQSAATSALNDVKVTISPETQTRMRLDAEETVRNARNAAQREATASTHSRLRGGFSGAGRYRILWGVFAVVVLSILIGIYYFTRRGDQGGDVTVAEQPAAATESMPTDSSPPAVPATPALFEQYRVALDRVGAPNLPTPKPAELTCVANAIGQVDGSPLDIAALRARLNACTPMSSRPTAASRIIATVQTQLTEEARAGRCGALQPVTIDGRHGNETSAALKKYVGCTAPVGVPQKLETLGDYAAVGVYFIDKRMRDAG